MGIYIVGKVEGEFEFVDFQWVTLRRTGAGYVVISINAHAWMTFNHPNDPDPVTGDIGYSYQDDDQFAQVGFAAYAGTRSPRNGADITWVGTLRLRVRTPDR